MHSRITKRAVQLVAATAASALLALAGASMASAAVTPSTIDATKKGSITIHKYEMPAAGPGVEADGADHGDLAGLTPMQGVEFTITKVNNVDLTTNAGWKTATTLTPAQAQSQLSATKSVVTTASTGIAKASNLDLGLYYVTETKYPAGVTPAAPFLITVPMTDPANLDKWMYDVHVYPKNSKVGGSKTVKDATEIAMGGPVVWTILGDIPAGPATDGYRIVDPLDTRLTYKTATVTLTSGPALSSGTDYTTSFDAASNTVTVEFTATGRDKLAAAKTADASAQVKVVLDTIVNAVSNGIGIDGDIINVAWVYPNQASFAIKPGKPGETTPGTPTDPNIPTTPVPVGPVETKLAAIKIHKRAAENQALSLAGAQFKLYPTAADAAAGTNAITIDGTSTWTTGADGTVTITGLRQSDFADNQQLTSTTDPKYQYFWLVETKAPTGRELLAEPIKTTAMGLGANATTLEIDNAKHNDGFTLPFTGSPLSATLFYGAGALVVIAGVVYMTVRRRRQPAQQS
ncbi:SpaH/EbpB family LPXTG-anchored major pilin [Leifsonia sp. F6_8S_P_1B]|uniref:SpaH/EbpB family LPXTG-anchored major pilin n=1 Tax=Leifsonia williamsii TaxID=3035919 RepID=A0ABT8KBB0_9MICO|nr:SpaH/EbpB family LPXTG-anchored major pilin [Leifsonia williamsii]MDN4614719.1 SpaH/EbpB family LPXTG-anchored major pilin [Leifsonia williamsii]